MSTKKCPTCGEAFRKGKRRVVLHFDGSIAASLVCPACVSRSVSFVTPFPRAGLTVNGVQLLQRVSDRLRTMISAATMVGAPTSDEQAFTQGRIAALSSAIELVQRAIAGVEP
jgi:hypothetical protein